MSPLAGVAVVAAVAVGVLVAWGWRRCWRLERERRARGRHRHPSGGRWRRGERRRVPRQRVESDRPRGVPAEPEPGRRPDPFDFFIAERGTKIMNDCGRHLVELPHDLPVGYPFVCACCQRVWELRDRTFLGRLAFWRHTEPARDKLRVWVRLSKFASLLQQSIQERG